MKFSAVLLFMVLWFTFATCRSRTWSGSGPARMRITDAATLVDADQRQGRLALAEGRARLRGRHGRAHQRRRRRPGRRLRDRQARRLRQGIDGAAQPDADDDRRLAAVGGLVRLQRRLGARSRRHRRARVHQHASRHRRAPCCRGCSASGWSRASRRCWAPRRAPSPAWSRSRRRAATSASTGALVIGLARRRRLPVGRQRPEEACSAPTTRSTCSACTASAASSARC